MVLLDGAGITGTETVCHHGVAWYAHTLGATLLGQLSREPGADLTAALADAIGQVAGLHRYSCDLANPISPQATVAIIRVDEERVEFLVLADAFIVLDSAESGPQVVTDPREVTAQTKCSAELQGLLAGTPEYERALLSATDALRARRNQPGGYWIAKDDPDAATQAVTGSASLGHLNGAALLSNGASRIVDHLADWPTVLDLLRNEGPAEILRRVRAAEADGQPDDATVAFARLIASNPSPAPPARPTSP